MVADLLDARCLFVVAQRPFDLAAGQFCTLAPIALLDDPDVPLRSTEQDEFPNGGLVWWMVTDRTHRLAVPGQLVVGTLEEARDYRADDPGSSFYQAKREAVSLPDPGLFAEVLRLEGATITRPTQLISTDGLITLSRPPAQRVFVRWGENVYGPFQTSTRSSESGEFRVALIVGSGQPAYVVPAERFDAAALHDSVRVIEEVSDGPQSRRHPGAPVFECRLELVHGRVLNALRAGGATPLVLKTDAEVVKQIVERVLTRKQRQEFRKQLDSVRAFIDERKEELTEDETAVFASVQELLLRDHEATRRLADALVRSGLLDDKVKESLDRAGKQYVEENTAVLQARIREEIKALELQREKVRNQIRDNEGELAKTSHQLKDERAKADQMYADRLKELEQERLRLEAENARVGDVVQNLTKALDGHVQDIATEILAQMTLLRRTGVQGLFLESGSAKVSQHESTSMFSLPAFVQARTEATREVTEPEFMERFVRCVRDAGFGYRELDLVSFHMSVKCGSLTILGGVSGLGKSSLPRLYAAAMKGEESAERYLEVAVSPAWLEVRDLLGYVNALDRRFNPAETGLYEQLILAQEEFSARGDLTGMYLVSLDEMNLAQVEHYFSPFLQVLEQSDAGATVKCFSPSAVDESCAFRRWAVLRVPPSVRFVGTVNFDETTKPLSPRLLDRANLIVLRPARLSAVPFDVPHHRIPDVAGPPVTLLAASSWVRTGQLSEDLATIIDAITPHFAAAGAPLTPRRYSALVRFVTSTPPEFCKGKQALDLQIAQRLLPQVRPPLDARAQEGVEAIREALESHASDFGETLAGLSEIMRRNENF